MVKHQAVCCNRVLEEYKVEVKFAVSESELSGNKQALTWAVHGLQRIRGLGIRLERKHVFLYADRNSTCVGIYSETKTGDSHIYRYTRVALLHSM